MSLSGCYRVICQSLSQGNVGLEEVRSESGIAELDFATLGCEECFLDTDKDPSATTLHFVLATLLRNERLVIFQSILVHLSSGSLRYHIRG
jgi:hypothetical protein